MDSSGSKDKKSVPKFGSFKPPTNSAAVPAPDRHRPGRETRDREGRDARSSRHHRHDDRSRSPRRSSHRERRRSPSRPLRSLEHRASEDRRDSHRRHASHSRFERSKHEALEGSMKEDASAKAHSGHENLFVRDRNGDEHNLTYGPSHRYSIPSYRHSQSGVVMGSPGKDKIDRVKSTEGTVMLRGSAGPSAAKRDKPLSNASTLPKQLFRPRRDESPYDVLDLTKDFVALNPGASNDGTDSDDDSHAYRSIRGRVKEEVDDPMSDAEPIPSEEVSYSRLQIEVDDERKERNADLWRAVKVDPMDVASWLRLINHQDILIRGPKDCSGLLTSAERHSLADVKLSLYEKALKAVGDSPHRDPLLLGRLQEGAQLWEPEKLQTRWDQTLHANPGFISLWVKYINFRQTEFLGFNLEQCVAIFVECLELNSTQPGPHQTQIHSYIFLRLTLFLREAGYTELAVGLWQAVLEFVCFHPLAYPAGASQYPGGLDKDDALHAFSTFWESEVARIGEANAEGWGSGKNPELSPVETTFEFKVDLDFLLQSWPQVERERTVRCRTPFRSVDGSGSTTHATEDPHRVVLVEDFKRILPVFWGLQSSEELVDSFLYFCHLPHPTAVQNGQTTRMWSGDSFLRNEYLDNVCYRLMDWIPSKDATDIKDFSPVSPFTFTVDNFLHTTDNLFTGPDRWFSSFRFLYPGLPNHMNIIDYAWVRRAIGLLVDRFPQDVELAEYAMALEFAANPKGAQSFAKAMVGKRPSSIRLWNAYALIESQMGRVDMADHVFSNMMSMAANASVFYAEDCGLLYHSWAWDLVYRGLLPQASYLIYSMSRGPVNPEDLPRTHLPLEFGGTEIFRTRNFLEASQETALARRKPQVFANYVDCLGLFNFLVDLPLVASFTPYSRAVEKLRGMPGLDENFKEFTAELLLQAQARLAYFIMTLPSMSKDHSHKQKLARRRQIRDVLRESLKSFPHNTIFLSLVMWVESRLPVLDRVRDMLDFAKATIKADPFEQHGDLMPPALAAQGVPISSHLFSIFMELCRPVFTGASLHSARAAFEKAIGEYEDPSSLHPGTKDVRHKFSVDSARSSLTVWKLYILWELHYAGSIDGAKAVFYRAVCACPWSKELLMMAFEHLRHDLPNLPETENNEVGLQSSELHQVYNVLVRRGMRIHIDIEAHVQDARRRSAALEWNVEEETSANPTGDTAMWDAN